MPLGTNFPFEGWHCRVQEVLFFIFIFLCFIFDVLHVPLLMCDLGVARLEVAVEKDFCSLPSCCSGIDSIRTTRWMILDR